VDEARRALSLGVRAIVEYGVLRMSGAPEGTAPDAVTLAVPGRVRFGVWDVRCELDPGADAGLRADAAELLESVGVEEAGMNQLARVGFSTLGLQTYLTAGPKETRAWTIHQGWTAPQAAGVIHTDFQRGFIKAEIVSFDDLIAAGSMASAKAAGKVRIEGKDYVMADGDVVEFRFNV